MENNLEHWKWGLISIANVTGDVDLDLDARSQMCHNYLPAKRTAPFLNMTLVVYTCNNLLRTAITFVSTHYFYPQYTTNWWQLLLWSTIQNRPPLCSKLLMAAVVYLMVCSALPGFHLRGGICPCRQCRRQCKIFASGVNFSIFTHFLCIFLLKLLKLGQIDGVKFLAWKSGSVKFLTNSMSDYLP